MRRKLFDDPAVLPAIALHQPFAGGVRLCGFGFQGKRDETRDKRTSRRGWVVFCSTLTREDRPDVLEQLRRVGVPDSAIDEAVEPLGHALAVGRIVGVRPPAEASYERALYFDPNVPRYSWEIADIWPVSPFKVKCMPGFFPLDREVVISHVLAQTLRMLEGPRASAWVWSGGPEGTTHEVLTSLERDLRT